MASLSLTFLGTGTSVGVPVIGCACPVCCSTDPRNRRTRSSVVVRDGDAALLVDTGPDLREQALRENLTRIDAVLYTHAHLDHVVGFDELRAFCWRRPEGLPLHATPNCMATLRAMFGWAFEAANAKNGGYVRPAPSLIDGPISFGGLRVTPLPVEHAAIETIGFLFEDGSARLAYLPDVKRVPATTLEMLRGVDALIVDALREHEHPTHFTTREAVDFARVSGAKRTWLTHLGHENDHAALEAALPDGIGVAYDGLTIQVVRG
ncbi:MAG: MBL fold metallo-hydrolase [Luteolibacter sp.]|jgi:phosphoribosyl 1,2-cyclic phosphate phosphodiesterase